MPTIRDGLRFALLGTTLAGCAAPAPSAAPDAAASGATPDAAARAFVATLADSARASALFPLASPERTRWFFVPQARVGLPLKRMRPQEKAAAEALLRTALSEAGYRRAAGIVANEPVLRALEVASGTPGFERRDAGLYYVSVFGAPSRDSAWAWRYEGHHLSVNVSATGDGRQVVAPLFMGANPARVPSGPEAGRRLLAEEEDLARELLLMLDPAQRARVVISERTYGEIVTRNDPKARPLAAEGLAAGEMTPPQRAQLRRLLEVYARRMAPEAARAQLERIESAGFAQLRFAWAGSAEVGRQHYYRIHGPTVLVEYDNSQNNANHIHTVWRDLENDFGGDLLRRHYAAHPRPHQH